MNALGFPDTAASKVRDDEDWSLGGAEAAASMLTEQGAADADLVRKINKDFARAVAYRAPWIEDRELAIDYKESRQWPSTSNKKIQITRNRILPAMNRIMSVMSKAKMAVIIEGEGPEDAIKGKIMDRQFQRDYRRDSTEFKFFKGIEEGRTSGLGVGKESWDWTVNPPYGAPRYDMIPPTEILLQPGARDLQYEDATYIIHVRRFSVDELKIRHPEFANEIMSDRSWLDQAQRSQASPQYLTTDKSYRLAHDVDAPPAGEEIPEVAYLKEYWYKKFERVTKRYALRNIQYVLMPVMVDDEKSSITMDGQPSVTTIEAGSEIMDEQIQQSGLELQPGVDFEEYPIVMNKMWVAEVINDHLVSNRPTPFGHNNYPFVFFKAIVLDKFTYPAGDIIFLVELQDAINKLQSVAVENVIRSNNAPIISDRALPPKALEKLQKYGSVQGMVIELARGAKVERLAPGALPEAFLTILRSLDQAFDELSGTQPTYPAPRSGEQVEQLRLNGEIFHQPKSSPIQQALLWHAKLRVANIQKLRKQKEMIRIDDRLQKAIEGTSHRPFLGKDQLGQPYYTANQPGLSPSGDIVNLNDLSVGNYDVKATLSADYQETRRSQAEISLAIRKMGDIPRLKFLEDMGYEDAEELTKQVDEENSLLQLGKKVAEDPALMAAVQDPAILQQFAEYLKARQAIGGGVPPPAAPPQMPMGAPAMPEQPMPQPQGAPQ